MEHKIISKRIHHHEHDDMMGEYKGICQEGQDLIMDLEMQEKRADVKTIETIIIISYEEY